MPFFCFKIFSSTPQCQGRTLWGWGGMRPNLTIELLISGSPQLHFVVAGAKKLACAEGAGEMLVLFSFGKWSLFNENAFASESLEILRLRQGTFLYSIFVVISCLFLEIIYFFYCNSFQKSNSLKKTLFLYSE